MPNLRLPRLSIVAVVSGAALLGGSLSGVAAVGRDLPAVPAQSTPSAGHLVLEHDHGHHDRWPDRREQL